MATLKNEDSVKPIKQETNKLIAFRFQFIPKNGKHSFEYFKKNFRKKVDAFESLHEKLSVLSSQTINEVRQTGKIGIIGGEQIPLSQFADGLKSSLKAIPHISSDSKLTVFRFYQQKYRLICIEDTTISNILYVVAFDFDMTAYDH